VEEDEAPGLWTSFGTALRLIVGWFCVAIGVLNLLVGVDWTGGDPDTAYVTFHGMLVVGGLLLLSLSRLVRRPGTIGYLAGGLVAAAGLLVGSIPVNNTVCCMTGFAIRHGCRSPSWLATSRPGAGMSTASICSPTCCSGGTRG
jgi:hypothetical protein